MGLYKPRTQAGIHSATLINKTTGKPYCILKVLSSYSPSFSRETVELTGGSNPNAIDSIDGVVDNSLTLTVKEFHNSLYTLAGYDVTFETGGESDGATANFTNLINTTVFDASTGIASVSVDTGNADNVKDGRYYAVCTSASGVVDLYCSTDIQFDRGTDVTYLSDDLKVASDQTITSGSDTDINNLGLSLTGATGTISMTEGDVAYFDVRSENEAYGVYSYGDNPTPIEFELWLYSQKKSNGEFFADHYPRVKFSAVPAGMTSQEWLEAELACKVLYDQTFGYSQKRFDLVKDLS